LIIKACFIVSWKATNQHLISATWRERDMKKQLKDAFEEMNRSKEIMDLQNKRISESINYAQRIQMAINASEKRIDNYFLIVLFFINPKM
jgi:hypothetical protein